MPDDRAEAGAVTEGLIVTPSPPVPPEHWARMAEAFEHPDPEAEALGRRVAERDRLGVRMDAPRPRGRRPADGSITFDARN